MPLKKKMCKVCKNDMKDKLEEVKEAVKKPEFICKKCARVSSSKKNICKPEEL